MPASSNDLDTDNIDDIPLDESESSAGGNQLPNVEEYKAQVAASTPRPRSKLSRRRRQRVILLTAATVLVIVVAIIIGVVVGRDTSAQQASDYVGSPPDIVPAPSPVDDDGAISLSTPAPNRPFQNRHEEIAHLVVSENWSAAEDVELVDSPRYKAIEWLADIDEQQLDIAVSSDFRQRYVMAVLYYSMGGSGWYAGQFPAMTNKDVCEWQLGQEDEDGNLIVRGVRCFGSPFIKELDFTSGDLEGSIPGEIALLYDLEGLYLGVNDIVGEIITRIGSLQSLQSLHLNDNNLVGEFPQFLGFMASMQSLDLSRNNLHGSLPSPEFIKEGFKRLERLALGYNDFVDDISKLSVLESIRELDLSNCSFSGDFTNELLNSWPDITVLDMSDNLFDNVFLPEDLFNMPYLRVIDLHGNSFRGNLPGIVRPDSPMEFIAFQDNELDGSIDVITEQMPNLRHLDLSNNGFTGPIGSLEKLTKLEYLFLAFNTDLDEGPIPTGIMTMPRLIDLSLQSTLRIGTIPVGFGVLQNLVLLDLSYNNLSGRIPDGVALAPSLNFLFLNRNNLNGTIPDAFSQATNLQVLLLDRNEFTGNSNAICADKSPDLNVFISDCDEIACPVDTCCTECCEDGQTQGESVCYDQLWNAQLDAVSSYESKRSAYRFNNKSGLYIPMLPEPVPEPAPVDSPAGGTVPAPAPSEIASGPDMATSLPTFADDPFFDDIGDRRKRRLLRASL